MTPVRPYPSAHATVLALFAASLLLPAYEYWAGDTYLLIIGARAYALALAALSLAFLLGGAGLVSLGQASCLGLGAYAVAISARYGIDGLLVQLLLAAAASAAFSLLTGIVALRTSGVFFIMITLAFAQMAFYFFVGMSPFGGDDGLTLTSRSRVGPIDLANPFALYGTCLFVAITAYLAARRVLASPFGLALAGTKFNARRMVAMGSEPLGYRLVAYVGAGVLAGVAGVLLANVTGVATPSFLGWQRSGDLLVMTVIGGVGSLPGSILGAFVVLVLESWLPALWNHWEILLGLTFVALAFGADPSAWSALRRRAPRRPHHAG